MSLSSQIFSFLFVYTFTEVMIGYWACQFPLMELYVLSCVIPAFLCLCLIPSSSPDTVIKRLKSTASLFLLWRQGTAAHISHASPPCQQRATCFAPDCCTADPQTLSETPPLNAVITLGRRNRVLLLKKKASIFCPTDIVTVVTIRLLISWRHSVYTTLVIR